ncbi:MAG: hypothetical protein Q7S42_01735 [Candidatus Omnitrophota bacterium]|nr:hypothetical protein [Candidatus Omnitrophota bacterium]
MQVEIFALCDAATADFGKLSMLGAFDSIWVTQTPAVHPQCAIALRARFERIERGEHKVIVHFVDMDGKNVIAPAEGIITINFTEDQSSNSANLILNIQGLKLERMGEYSIDLAIDGQQKASLPLFVKERK